MFNQRRRYGIHRLLSTLFLGSLTLCLWLGHLPSTVGRVELAQVATAQSTDSQQLVQQGIDQYQAGDFEGAIATWEIILSKRSRDNAYSSDEVIAMKNLARAYQQVGRVEQAITYLSQIITYYRQIGDVQQVGRMLTEQAQAYSRLGQHRQAIAILCGNPSRGPERVPAPRAGEHYCNPASALEIARSVSDELGAAAALGSLGNAHFLWGEYSPAIQYLEQSLEIANKIDRFTYVYTALNSLGNIYTSLAGREYSRAQLASQLNDESTAQNFRQNAARYDDKAIQYFQDSLGLARRHRDREGEVRTLLNLSICYYRRRPVDASAKANDPLQQALAVWQSLPDSRDKAYDAIKLANLLQLAAHELQKTASLIPNPSIENPKSGDTGTQCLGAETPRQAVELLNQAVLIAQHIHDRQAESFALGTLGHAYECSKQYEPALSLTQQAQLAAISKESLYLWEWQAGRILKAQDRKLEAIAAYTKSIESLKSIRSDIIIASRDLQLDFRKTVEPVYRQLAELKLDLADSATAASDAQKNLKSALETIDELRLAELQNYLGNDCGLAPIKKQVALVDKSTAVVSSIILKERIAIILTLPDGKGKLKSQIHWLPVNSQQATEIVNELRVKLEKRSDRINTFRETAQQVYEWLIAPFAADLERVEVKTLVFIQDGILRSIPMAALYDGKQFLIEKYAIANVPSLKLVNPTHLDNKHLRVLAFGLTKPSTVDGKTFFIPLNYVKQELESILATIPKTKQLLDADFTPIRLRQELEKTTYPIIHLATHGRFGFDANETYLVTGNVVAGSKNEKLTMNQLYQIIRSNSRGKSAIELLVLTACETAAGSDRDALGIAGISLQAGAHSTLASLWQVDDAATAQLVVKFYQGLRQGLSKAKALQFAQKTWLEEHSKGHSHPGFWAPFILIGDWL